MDKLMIIATVNGDCQAGRTAGTLVRRIPMPQGFGVDVAPDYRK